MMTREDELKTALQNYDPQDGPGAFAAVLLDLAHAQDDPDQMENMEFGAVMLTFLELMVTGSTTAAGHKAVRTLVTYLKGRILQDMEE